MDFKANNDWEITVGFIRSYKFQGKSLGCYLVTNAFSLIAMQTSLNETSFVSVYPCKTLGSALVAVDAEVHGFGISSDSDLFSFCSCSSSASSTFECLNLSRALCTCDLIPCGFPPSDSISLLGSPSQTSISMQRQPRRRALSM